MKLNGELIAIIHTYYNQKKVVDLQLEVASDDVKRSLHGTKNIVLIW